jgi:hypothetical protein
MQLDERVLTHLVSERQSATFTTFTTAAWVTVTVPHPERTNANGIAVAKRDEAAATTIDTGIRREHAGGIIIGVSIGGLILLVFLAWCCTSGRRRSRSSDTSCSSRSTSRPSHSPTKTGTCFDIHDGPTSTELRILLKIHLHSAIPSPAIWQWPRKLPTTQSPAIPYGSASIEVRKRLNIQARSTTQ